MNLMINPATMNRLEALSRLPADESATFTSMPSKESVAEFVAAVRNSANALHEKNILTSSGVAEGFAQAGSVIENWRASLRS